MRRRSSGSARRVAFATAFCALGIAPGCGRESFDLLPGSTLGVAGSAAGAGNDSGGPGGGGTGGVPGSGGKSGGDGGDGGGGKAGNGGFGGGFGGRFGNYPWAGTGNNSGCLGEGGCSDVEPPICSKSSPFPFCIPCDKPKDCTLAGDAKVCDPEHKRCVQCINEFQCGFGEACNPANQRCAKACEANKDCAVDGQRGLCSRELGGVCVACIRNADCAGYGPFIFCNQSVCVQCLEDSQCASESCVSGRCVP